MTEHQKIVKDCLIKDPYTKDNLYDFRKYKWYRGIYPDLAPNKPKPKRTMTDRERLAKSRRSTTFGGK